MNLYENVTDGSKKQSGAKDWGYLRIISESNDHCLSIPENIAYIEKFAFVFAQIRELVLPTGLREISKGAFLFCKELGKLEIPKNSKLQIIRKYAFYGCTNLKNVKFPRSLRRIENYAFDSRYFYYNDLTDTQLTYIGKNPFGKSYGKTIKLPETLVKCKCYFSEINENNKIVKFDQNGYYIDLKGIFKGMESKIRIIVRLGIEYIRSYCFKGARLKIIVIPASVKVIGKKSFKSCEFLQKVIFMKNSKLDIIKKEAFYMCKLLKMISFPNSLRIIEKKSFFISGLEKVIFPTNSQLEEIDSPFGFTKIEHLYLPSSLKHIMNVSFEMYELISINISNEIYQSNDEKIAIYSKDGKELVCTLAQLYEFHIHPGTEVIKERSLVKTYIEKIVIPSSVQVIEKKAINIKNVIFEEGSKLMFVDVNAFYGMESLYVNSPNFKTDSDGIVSSISPRGIVFVPYTIDYVHIDDDVEVIHSFAFHDSLITYIEVPISLKIIGDSAFFHSKCVLCCSKGELGSIGKNALRTSSYWVKIPAFSTKAKSKIVGSDLEILTILNNFDLNKIKTKDIKQFVPKYLENIKIADEDGFAVLNYYPIH